MPLTAATATLTAHFGNAGHVVNQPAIDKFATDRRVANLLSWCSFASARFERLGFVGAVYGLNLYLGPIEDPAETTGSLPTAPPD